MKKEQIFYTAPAIEELVVKVEQGFAMSDQVERPGDDQNWIS